MKDINRIQQWLGTGSINIFGRPFAGKDTQSQQLANLFGGNVIGGGEILRSNDMPNHVKECLRTGQLIPSDDYVNIVLPYLNQSYLNNKPLFLSSVGRWHGEEDGVIEAIKASGHPLKAVIFLDISDYNVYDRWKALELQNDRSNRHDDSREIITTRLNEFREKTLPVIEYYRDLGILIEVDGKSTRDEVTNSILDQLYDKI